MRANHHNVSRLVLSSKFSYPIRSAATGLMLDVARNFRNNTVCLLFIYRRLSESYEGPHINSYCQACLDYQQQQAAQARAGRR